MDNNNKIIWIINQYASHLTARHRELSKYFATHGYRVAVITSSFHHGKREYLYNEPIIFETKHKDVDYVFLCSKPAYYNNGVRRVINMIDFCRLVKKNHRRIVDKIGAPRYVIASSAPPFVWEIGHKIAKRYHAKFIAEFRDIWPESFVDILGMSRLHPWVLFLSVIEKRAYRNSDAIVSTMPYAYKHVVDTLGFPPEKIHWMPNGISIEEVETAINSSISFPSNIKDYLDSHWSCIYVGSFVASENLSFIIDAIGPLVNEGIYLAIIGEGDEKELIEKHIAQEGISNVQVFPRVMKSQVAVILQHAKCCVAASCNHDIYRFGYSSNKISDYLCSGIPTVFSCVMEGYKEDDGCIKTPAGDIEAFRKAIRRVKLMNSEDLNQIRIKEMDAVRRKYDYNLISKNYLTLLETL